MTDTSPPPPEASPDRAHKTCSCCGKVRERRKPGRKAISDSQEWGNPKVVAKVREVGRRVRFLREKMNLTQVQVAEISGTNMSAIQDIEAGTPVNIIHYIVLSDGIGCALSRLAASAEMWDKWIAEKLPLVEKRRKEILAKLNEQP